MKLFGFGKDKELEVELRYESIMREIARAEERLERNRAQVLQWGKEAVRMGDDNLIALSASGLKRIDTAKQQLARAKTIIGLMHTQGITTKTLEPFFSVVQGLSELAVNMGIKDAAKAKKELEVATKKMADFDIIYKTALGAVSPAVAKSTEIQPYIEELKAKALAEEEEELPESIVKAKKGIEEIRKEMEG
ncbi:MAG: hypothetical protein J7K08_05820 [Thermoplasmata archaeon]|nr:hypothetical protein [Thermoplasmata archaeon]